MSTPVRVGIFVALLLGVLLWGTLKLTGERGIMGGGYRVSLVLESAEGLRAGGFVRMAGVPIGQVESIELEGTSARIHVRIKGDVRLREDCQVTAKTTGILGDRFLDIRGCTDAAPEIQDGGEIKRIGVSTSLDEITSKLSGIAENIKSVTDALSSVLGGKKGEEQFGAMVEDLRGTIHSVRQIVEENRGDFSRSMANFRKISESLGESAPVIADKLEHAAEDIQEFVKNNRGRLEKDLEQFDKMVAELSESAKSLRNITEKIDKGEGTLGKLVNDPALADSLTKTIGDVQGAVEKIGQLKIGVEYRGEVMMADRQGGGSDTGMKNYLSVRAQPRPDKYFRFGVVVDPLAAEIDRSREYDATGAVRLDDKGNRVEAVTASSKDIRFSVEIAKRYSFLTLRGGLLESTAGVGMDMQFFRDALMFSAEGFDFARDARPHLKVRAEYTFLRYITANVGYDDPLYRPDTQERNILFEEFGARRRPSVFFGGGMRFTDEDLKTLLPFIPGL
ncbi:MAG: MCE family protein [Nitrospirae bacterium]|nr:MCE family protein [Nitrospirota bacterium]